MKKFILFSIMLSALSSTIISCGSPPKKETDSSSTTPTVKDVNFDQTPKNTTLYVGVQTRWEGGTELVAQGNCTALTTDTPEAGAKDCNISIPEGQLYYSDVIITLGSKAAEFCSIVSFSSYYYRRSKVDDYVPPGSTEKIKCASDADAKANIGCWGGAGPLIYSDFPKTGGQYFTLASGLSTSITIPAANARRYGSNRATTNTLVDRTVDNADYVADTMSDYYITCRDIWAQPIYQFKLTIKDEDTQGTENMPARNQIPDWQGF
ncbi:hypothetical protein DOM22_19755 [Bdellovibrio sp. ZAP7]|uniref:hypothetical protein n=1 Tax=Bdellovibrio sp. ZAP7 TaxID=2231053 RepID=UPI0011584C54|nr:hypothetical protein [Bdellovibrio sp. ZAP7]QDK47240.1 hypothetical protein DOM22_19755 [Bdellovibrio sp. ZAP7]